MPRSERPWHRRPGGLLAPGLAVAVALAGLLGPTRGASAATPLARPGARGPNLSGPPPPGATTVPDGTAGKVAGMAIPNVDPQQSAAEVQRLHSDGLNTISLFVWWWMPKQDSNLVERCDGAMAANSGCNPTETDTQLQVQMAAARQFGMKTILVPIFYCGTCEGGWRGTAQPSDRTAWFASYRQFIDHYADLASQNRATTLFVGSEMTSLESDTSDWEEVISEARQHFSGQIGYEENWDVLGSAHFLSDVDLVGVSAYFPLDDGRSPALGDILGDWSNSHASAYQGRNWVGAVEHLARSTGKPILFGEVGYLSGDYAAKQPYLNYLSTTNWQLQSDLYQAVLEKFEGQPWWAGAVWWEWYLSDNTTKDNTRTPRGKTAESLLAAWYGAGWRPSDPTTPLVVSPAAYSPDSSEAVRPAQGSSAGGPSGTVPAQGSGAVGSQVGTAGGQTGSAGVRPNGVRSQGGAASPASGASSAGGGSRSGQAPSAAASRRGAGLSNHRRSVDTLGLVVLLLVLGALVALGRGLWGTGLATRSH